MYFIVLLSYFEKNRVYICQWFKHMIFVALSVRMSVAGANKVEGTMS